MARYTLIGVLMKKFETSGYETDDVNERCWMCSGKPVRIEPRFGYAYCENCMDLSPVSFSNAPYRPVI